MDEYLSITILNLRINKHGNFSLKIRSFQVKSLGKENADIVFIVNIQKNVKKKEMNGNMGFLTFYKIQKH